MGIIIGLPGCTLEDIVLKCPDLTWKLVFRELDRLSGEGRVFLKQEGAELYPVSPTHGRYESSSTQSLSSKGE